MLLTNRSCECVNKQFSLGTLLWYYLHLHTNAQEGSKEISVAHKIKYIIKFNQLKVQHIKSYIALRVMMLVYMPNTWGQGHSA